MKNLIVSRNTASKRKTRRSPAQKAASRSNIKKAQAATRRGGRRRTSSKRRPAKRCSYRRRSNPRLPTLKGIFDNQVMPAMVGGGGAVLNDLLVNLVPIPENFKAGYLRHVSKAVGAIAIGYVGAMFLPRNTANQLGAGAMTVVGYNVVRDVAARFAPQLPLGEYLPMGEYLDPALGYYGAGLDPSGDMNVSNQFTRGTPYIDTGEDVLSMWPTGAEYEDVDL